MWRSALVYLLLSLVVTWPLVLSPQSAYLGFANIDALDTLTLRGLFAATAPWEAPWTDAVFFPTGYPALQLTPNVLDHLTGALLAKLLPFPLSDNLWWWAVLTLNGLAGHRLGRRLGGSEAAGWLCGSALLLSEPLAREANLHHAPQAMLFWAPLYLDAVLTLRERPSWRAGAWAGLWLAGAGWSYWYYALFLAMASLPLLPGVPLLPMLALGGVALAVAAPGLMPWLLLFDDLPITSMSPPDPAQPPASFSALPRGKQFIAQHSGDLLFWLRPTPIDTTNRVSIALIVAAALGARALPAGTRRGLLGWTLIGGVMLLGPYLRWGPDILLVSGQPLSLPFDWLGQLHPFLARLTWPERWGIIFSLGLIALAARAPRPLWFAALIAAESVLLSGNLPVQVTSLRHERCWADLSGATGAILELPLRRPGLRTPRVGVHRRFHRRPVVNPILLPPGISPPPAWQSWKQDQPLIAYLQDFESGTWPPDPGASSVRALQHAGVSAIALDVEPDTMLTEGQINRFRAGLGSHFGRPIDLGCALVWWFDPTAPPPQAMPDGDAWRAAAAKWKADHPAPALDTLIQPTWDVVIGGLE